jgi:U3 small nucleolar RNA-associated protein 23
VITQCSIRHLYTAEAPDAAAKNAWIDTAKSFERRRCNHHTLEEPLSTLECLKSVVDPKDSSTNKNRYVIASQDQKVRSAMRKITGVPLIYVNRSVMIMEPMATQTEEFREAEEMGKVRAGLKGRRGAAPEQVLKRKRDDEDDDEEGEAKDDAPAQDTDAAPKKRVKKGPKGPNPLSVKKSKKQTTKEEAEKQAIRKATKLDPQAAEKALGADVAVEMTENDASEAAGKKRRRRKHKTAGDSTADQADADDTPAVAMEVDA